MPCDDLRPSERRIRLLPFEVEAAANALVKEMKEAIRLSDRSRA